MEKKRNKKTSKRMLKKALDSKDPFDQLIMQLAQKNVLDVNVVAFKNKPKGAEPPPHEYKQSLFHLHRNHFPK
jgi:hypothetical protein